MKHTLKREKILFSLLELLFTGSTAKSVFTVIYLKEKGLTNTQIGLLFSINAILAIFAQPLWGIISDRCKSNKTILMFCYALGAAFFMLLLPAKSLLLIGILLGANSVFEAALASLLDVWVLYSSVGKSYSAIRVWGSIGYSAILLLFGEVIGTGSVSAIFPFYLFIAVAALVSCFLVKIKSAKVSNSVNLREMFRSSLFRNGKYVVFVLFIFLIYLPNAPSGTFMPNLFKNVGGNWREYGFMNSLRSASEIPFFLLGGFLLKKFGHLRLIFFSGFLYIAQMVLYATATTPLQIALTQMLQGPAYSLMLQGMLFYIFALSPSSMRTTAQTMANAIGMGLSAIIGNYGGGVFIDKVGLRPLYWTGALNDLTAIAFFALSLILIKVLGARRKRGEDMQATDGDGCPESRADTPES